MNKIGDHDPFFDFFIFSLKHWLGAVTKTRITDCADTDKKILRKRNSKKQIKEKRRRKKSHYNF
jgi:hypothetical protein